MVEVGKSRGGGDCVVETEGARRATGVSTAAAVPDAHRWWASGLAAQAGPEVGSALSRCWLVGSALLAVS